MPLESLTCGVHHMYVPPHFHRPSQVWPSPRQRWRPAPTLLPGLAIPLAAVALTAFMPLYSLCSLPLPSLPPGPTVLQGLAIPLAAVALTAGAVTLAAWLDARFKTKLPLVTMQVWTCVGAPHLFAGRKKASAVLLVMP